MAEYQVNDSTRIRENTQPTSRLSVSLESYQDIARLGSSTQSKTQIESGILEFSSPYQTNNELRPDRTFTYQTPEAASASTASNGTKFPSGGTKITVQPIGDNAHNHNEHGLSFNPEKSPNNGTFAHVLGRNNSNDKLTDSGYARNGSDVPYNVVKHYGHEHGNHPDKQGEVIDKASPKNPEHDSETQSPTDKTEDHGDKTNEVEPSSIDEKIADLMSKMADLMKEYMELLEEFIKAKGGGDKPQPKPTPPPNDGGPKPAPVPTPPPNDGGSKPAPKPTPPPNDGDSKPAPKPTPPPNDGDSKPPPVPVPTPPPNDGGDRPKQPPPFPFPFPFPGQPDDPAPGDGDSGDGGFDPGGGSGGDKPQPQPPSDGGDNPEDTTPPGDGIDGVPRATPAEIQQAMKQIENRGASDSYIRELEDGLKQQPQAFVKALIEGKTRLIAVGEGPRGLGGTYNSGSNTITMYETSPFSTSSTLAAEMGHNWDLNPRIGKHVSSESWFQDAYQRAKQSGIRTGDNTLSNVYEFLHHMSLYYAGNTSGTMGKLMDYLGADYKRKTKQALIS